MTELAAAAVVRWNPHAIPWALFAPVLATLAIVIFKRQSASRVAVLFSAMILLVAVWFASFAVMLAATDRETAFLAARIALTAVCLLPATVHDFTVTALRLVQHRAIVNFIWAVGSVFAVLTFFTHGIVGEVRLHSWGWYPVAGTLLLPFLVLFFGALVAQLIEGVAEQRRETDRRRRRRIGGLMLAFLIVDLAAIDFAPMFGAPWPPVGYVPVAAFLLLAWNSIRRHRLPPITAARAAREILQTMADALFVLDTEGRIRVINGAVRTLVGFSEADLLGRSIDTLEADSEAAAISETLRELVLHGPVRDEERLLRQADGGSIPVSISISPVTDGDVLQGAVVIARDIRARKRADEELRSFARRLELSNRELEDFAYVASHDLQEPLRKIQAFGDLLRSKHGSALPPQAVDYIGRMQAAAQRMQVLINDLLSFSRITTKAQPFAHADLAAIAREVVHDLEIRIQEVGGRVEIGDLPSLDADPLQMRQLLQNLIGNALKFHREGVPPLVQITGEADDMRVRLVVADNGIGFEEKYAERIFTVFERLHGRGRYEGTGIGLAICRKIAERHGGSIVAQSTPGAGSAFTVTLLRHQLEGGEARKAHA